MTSYYLLLKKGNLYRTTSERYMEKAIKKGYKYIGDVSGIDLSFTGTIYLLDVEGWF